jgi:hypothetical protein
VIEFDSKEPELAGEMMITWTLVDTNEGTAVTVLCENIPRGVRLEDNETGCRSTLKKLAAFIECSAYLQPAVGCRRSVTRGDRTLRRA